MDVAKLKIANLSSVMIKTRDDGKKIREGIQKILWNFLQKKVMRDEWKILCYYQTIFQTLLETLISHFFQWVWIWKEGGVERIQELKAQKREIPTTNLVAAQCALNISSWAGYEEWKQITRNNENHVEPKQLLHSLIHKKRILNMIVIWK